MPGSERPTVRGDVDVSAPMRSRASGATAVEEADPFVARPDQSRLRRGRGWLDRFGWRAYAVPVLVVITVLALVNAVRFDGSPKHAPVAAPTSHPRSASPPPTAAGTEALKGDAAGARSASPAPATDALPAGGPYTVQGAGTYRVLPGTAAAIGSGTLFTYSIDVEDGVAGIDLTAFAQTVQQVLSDPRSWTHGGGVSLQRVDSGTPNFQITLTSSMTVRQLCGYQIPIETSCYAPSGQGGSDVNRVVINDSRWVRGDAAYIGDLAAYQIYMINHETGHALGHLHAHNCLVDGLAPAMMQQTIGLRATNGQICQSNPWPYPVGATDAPGAEAPDTAANDEFNLQHQ